MEGVVNTAWLCKKRQRDLDQPDPTASPKQAESDYSFESSNWGLSTLSLHITASHLSFHSNKRHNDILNVQYRIGDCCSEGTMVGPQPCIAWWSYSLLTHGIMVMMNSVEAALLQEVPSVLGQLEGDGKALELWVHL